jgi:P pilus assembly chaperone PapD
MQAGGEYTNAVRVLNDGHEPIRLRSYLEDWFLDEAGTPIFRPVGTVEHTASVWMDAAPADFLLNPGQTKYVRFTVRTPEGLADGGYHGTLLLESLPLDRSEQKGMQMFVQGRIAVMVYVSVGDPRRSAEITALSTVRKNGANYLRMKIANTGEDFIRLAGDVTVLEGTEAVEGAIPVPDVPVLPGTSRWVEFPLTNEHMFANYLARVTIDIAGFGVLVGEAGLDPAKVELID